MAERFKASDLKSEVPFFGKGGFDSPSVLAILTIPRRFFLKKNKLLVLKKGYNSTG